jgi:hypothetical protein
MNRALFALALGIASLSIVGCATAVEDPVLPTPAPEAQRDPPQQTLSGELRQPQLQEIAKIDNNTPVLTITAKQRPPIPQPAPMAEER